MLKLVGHVFVDSHRIVIIDPFNLPLWTKKNYEECSNIKDASSCLENQAVCVLTSDGFYPVYADIQEDGVHKVVIDFEHGRRE